MPKRSKFSKSNAKGSKLGSSDLQLISKPDDEAEIEENRMKCQTEAPERGEQIRSDGELRLDQFPISTRTKQALELANFEICTEIQAAAIPHALAGRDILGAAKTGSGKTLAFVIPIIERLYNERWGQEDGLGALVLSPTRELAMQIFEVVRVIGKKHDLSAGLVTGGKKEFEEEQARIPKMNILIATPGRLLQHFEQTPGFEASNLLILVLDEADRILDMGFQQQLDGILSYLPLGRQSLLFSATQTKSVKALARLSLRNPQYVAIRDDMPITMTEEGGVENSQKLDSSTSIPPAAQLLQSYVVVQLPDKLDVLFSFIKSHIKSKMIVFFSTCSQVRYVYECFRGMQPGIPLTALHGKIKQERRTLIYLDFTRKKSACMFATDIASRGLDFPDVDWVVQVDAPEDTANYIHRVGRTARHKSSGRSLLMLMPNEEKNMLANLESSGLQIKKLTVNPKRSVSVATQASSLLAAAPEFRLLAKKSFTGYLRSLQLLPSNRFSSIDMSNGSSQYKNKSNKTHDKGVKSFLQRFPLDEFATSLGLGFTPTLPVTNERSKKDDDVSTSEAMRSDNRSKKNANRGLEKLKKQIAEAKLKKKIQRKLVESGIDPESEEGLLKYEEISAYVMKEKERHRSDDSSKMMGDGAFVNDEDGEDEEELFSIKSNSNVNTNSISSNNMNRKDSHSDSDNEYDLKLDSRALQKKKEKEQKKALKISSDGLSRSAITNTSKKVVFGDDGEALATDEPLRLLVKSKEEENVNKSKKKRERTDESDDDDDDDDVLPEANAERIAERMRNIKARVDEGRAADSAREKARIKEKHEKEKRDRRGTKSDEENMSDNSESDDDDDENHSRSDSEDSDSDSSMDSFVQPKGNDKGHNQNFHDETKQLERQALAMIE